MSLPPLPRRLSCCLALIALSTASSPAQAPGTMLRPNPPAGILEKLAGDVAVAHVYVTNTPAHSTDNQITAYSVGIAGHLWPIQSSPFTADDTGLAITQNQLFAINRTTPSIDAFSIAPDGSLSYLASTSYAQFNPEDCGFAGSLFPDRTATDLYATEFLGDCANNTYESFAPQDSGTLTNLGPVSGGAGSFGGVYLPAAFLGNNQFAYEASNDNCLYYKVWIFQRAPGGLLTQSDATTTLPGPPEGYRVYLPTMLATDPSNHVALALWPANPPGCSTAPQQIGIFTADANGNLTTTNTAATMPPVAIGSVNDLKISPAGNLLAVAGTTGLQIFRINGVGPVTPLASVLTTDPISELAWDRANHLIALSPVFNRLHVFAVTPFGSKEAPGSPYTINQPLQLAVQSR